MMGVPGQDLYKPAAFPITQPTVVNGGKRKIINFIFYWTVDRS